MTLWISLLVGVFGALALAGVGLVVVRPAAARAGWMLGGAGALLLVATCCVHGPLMAPSFDLEPPVAVWQLATVAHALLDLVVVALVAGAFVVIARAMRRA